MHYYCSGLDFTLQYYCSSVEGLSIGSVRVELLRKHCPDAEILEIENLLEGFKLVAEGRADAIFDDLASCNI